MIERIEKPITGKNECVRMLLVVDPQVDFINGSLPVPGAQEAMEALAEYISANDGKYALKVITADRHPYDHCSFRRNGGQWPDHCVHDTVGAAVWPSVFEAVYSTSGAAVVIHKGESAGSEEYSIFGNEAAAEELRDLIMRHVITEIDVCGLAGDVCVLSTLRDAIGLFPDCRFRVLLPYSPSLDGGATLSKFAEESGIATERV